MKFDMKKPCDDCPFRRDGKGIRLMDNRWEELTDALVCQQETFTCHKTVRYDLAEEDEDGNEHHPADGNEQHCAGAAIWLESINRPNQMMRIAERLSLYDRRALDLSIDCGPPQHLEGELLRFVGLDKEE